ncbi:hypothetical protein BH09ACT9_BH09ACT9_28560 [soil metagenome]
MRSETRSRVHRRVTADVHVTPMKGGWEVRRHNEIAATSVHATRRSAVNQGRVLAGESNSTLFIHGIDGTTVSEHGEAGVR